MINSTESRFFFGFEYPEPPTRRGRVYLDGALFANIWKINDSDIPKYHGMWALNRDALALHMRLPAPEGPFDCLADVRSFLEKWLENISEY
jgi:hypothetical protein